ncbi:MAG: Outer membrane protein assembly factor BamB [Hyphomicrobiaceae bacterium hypho_1]
MKPKQNNLDNLVIIFVYPAILALLAVLLPGCSAYLNDLNTLNLRTEKSTSKLTNKRTPILQQTKVTNWKLSLLPVALPKMIQNMSWSQPGGESNNAPGHLYLSKKISKVWLANIGSGSSSSGRLTSSPIVFDGRVYTLDAKANISSFSTSSGNRLWRVNLTPENENSAEGFGGGLAADTNRLYAATGFGLLVAIDPTNGKQLWSKMLGTPIRSSPTAAQNKVFVTATDGRFFCLNGYDGKIIWSYRGFSETTQISSNPSPAVDSDVAIAPYPNGDIVAIQISTGTLLWKENLTPSNGIISPTSMRDAARPVVFKNIVFAIGHGGRMIATQQKTGERLWTYNISGVQPPWIAGNNIFVVDLKGKLSSFERRNGMLIWTLKIPGSRTWFGPALGGGGLWLTSDKGALINADAETGRIIQRLSLGKPIFIAPVIANGMLFVLTDDAHLIAYR